MLKRRVSKRFVLAESGEQTSWDSTVDSIPANIDTDTISSPNSSTSSIAQIQITTEFYGSAKPISDNNTPDGRENNNRVEFVVQFK